MTDTNAISRRTLLSATAGGIVATGLGSRRAGAQANGGVLRLSNPANPSSLDPHTGNSGADHVALYPLYATLVEWEFATLQARPGVAESWAFTSPTTLVLKLRKDVAFHDGTPCDADAVKFNIERGKTLTRSTVKADLAAVQTVEAQGPDMVVLHLAEPNTALPLILSDRAGMMISPQAAKASPNGIDRKPVGAGAWKFVSWEDGAHVVYARNEHYFKNGLPHLDGMNMAIIPELNTGLRSVIAGENDLIFRVAPPQKPVIDRVKSLVPVMGPTLYVNMIYFNYGSPPLSDMRVRQAMNYAVDREAFNKATMLGLGEIAHSALPKSHWAHDPALDSTYPYDPAKARQLLQAAGLSNGLDLAIAGYPDQTSQQRQEVLIDMFGKVGIRLKWTRGSVADMSTQFFGPEKKYSAQLSAWTGRPDPSLTYMLLFSKDAYYNAGHTQPVPELPAALAAAQASPDIDKRREAFRTVQRLVVENALFLPLAFDPEIDAHSQKVKGYQPNLLGKPKFEEVWLS